MSGVSQEISQIAEPPNSLLWQVSSRHRAYSLTLGKALASAFVPIPGVTTSSDAVARTQNSSPDLLADGRGRSK